MPNIITGTSAGETITGTPDADEIHAGGGNDIVNAGFGDDVVFGGDGDDRLDGGGSWSPGDHDELHGEAGNDYLIIYAADGSRPNPYSIADGGDGFDTAELRFSNFGSPLNYVHDTTYAEVHCGRIAGIVENVESIVFYSGFADDHITGGPNADAIYGGGGNDVLSGAGGGDLLDGGSGDDTLFGGDGDDVFQISSSGNDTFDGGNGTDILSFFNWTGSTGVTVDLSLSSQTIDGRTIGIAGIENLGGTSFADTLRGTAGNNLIIGGAGSDTLTGGGGNDMFSGSAATLSGDTITDFGFGDSILIANTTAAALTFTLSGSTLTYTGGTLTLSNLPAGQFVAHDYSSPTAGSGVLLELAPPSAAAHNDFNGDGRSDILWRGDNGSTTDWSGQALGNMADNSANFFVNPGNSWHIAGTGDFNADTRVDLLWRNDDGTTTEWLGQSNGGFADNSANFFVNPGPSWHIAGTGDFNGDGHDDLLWRNDDGTTTEWLGQGNGAMSDNAAAFYVNLGSNWHIAGIGDFNGDGHDDLLWHNDNGSTTEWLGQANGGFADNASNFFVNLGSSWHLAGTGDFNGDGRSDILWRNDSGATVDWLGQANGGFADNAANFFVNPGTSWHVAEIGDFNGDHHADLLWRSDTGATTDWLGQANGGFADNSANFFSNPGTSWHVQDSLL